MASKWNCYDCMWSLGKCKCKDSNQYNKFLQDIEECNLTGKIDNSLGSSGLRWAERKSAQNEEEN